MAIVNPEPMVRMEQLNWLNLQRQGYTWLRLHNEGMTWLKLSTKKVPIPVSSSK